MELSTKYLMGSITGISIVAGSLAWIYDDIRESQREQAAAEAVFQEVEDRRKDLSDKLTVCFEHNPATSECREIFFHYKQAEEAYAIMKDNYLTVDVNKSTSGSIPAAIVMFLLVGGAAAGSSFMGKYLEQKRRKNYIKNVDSIQGEQ